MTPQYYLIRDPSGDSIKKINLKREPGEGPITEDEKLLIRMQFKIDTLESKAKKEQSGNIWREAIANRCTNSGMLIDTKMSPDDLLNALINREIRRALDPKHSPAAQRLVNQGYTIAFADTNTAGITNLGELK